MGCGWGPRVCVVMVDRGNEQEGIRQPSSKTRCQRSLVGLEGAGGECFDSLLFAS